MLKNKKNIILHVGLPKTASTFLQKKVFSKIKDIFFMHQGDGYFLSQVFIELQDINKPYLNKDFFKNSIHDKTKFKHIYSKIEEYFAVNINQKSMLISHEGFIGCGTCAFANWKENMKILKTLFPDPKIFLVIRKQDDWIESFYHQFLIERNITLNNCIGYQRGEFRFDNKLLNVHKLNWLELYNSYVNEFKKENILILPYEMLKADIKTFLDKFYKFSSFTPFYPENSEYVNKTIKNAGIKYKPIIYYYEKYLDKIKNKRLNAFIKKNDRGFKKFLSLFAGNIDLSSEKLTAYQKESINKIYSESNRELSRIIGIDLKQYGYY